MIFNRSPRFDLKITMNPNKKPSLNSFCTISASAGSPQRPHQCHDTVIRNIARNPHHQAAADFDCDAPFSWSLVFLSRRPPSPV
ncbi:hypothetical protein [Aestuariivirga sp.]|jgi:hypothetical protein|uniref:hypothetical protein n=1 Tax=Aestuariivirga sp. TaxID=2650926 RepID=UPI003783DFF7